MKTIQITVDEGLLAKLDAHEETKRDGRSAVFRRAAAEYLKHRRRESIAQRYREGYSKQRGLGTEFKGWENEGEWPTE
jgi:metal-responsive CopG/Arc/MetJ family transcriptional regulator